MSRTGKCIMIFGLSGAGKSTLSKIIHKRVENKIGKTVILDGNNIRELLKKNIVGIHIKPEIPKMIDIKVLNDFNRPLKVIGDELFKKIKKFL